MSEKLTVDIRTVARKLFVVTNWVLLIILLMLTMYSVSRGYDGGGVIWIMFSILFIFGLPYAAYYVAFRLSKQLSKSGEIMAVISAVASVLILAAIVYYVLGFAYLYINGNLRL